MRLFLSSGGWRGLLQLLHGKHRPLPPLPLYLLLHAWLPQIVRLLLLLLLLLPLPSLLLVASAARALTQVATIGPADVPGRLRAGHQRWDRNACLWG